MEYQVPEKGFQSFGFLKEIAKAIIESGKAKKVSGYEEFAASLEGVAVSAEANTKQT